MNKEKDVCYFYSPAQGNCAVLNIECTGTRSKRLCHFYVTEKEYYENRNKAVLQNRAKGNCFKCKYKSIKCDLIRLGGDEI